MTAPDAHVLLRAFCQELARCGVGHVATAPGSRSAPLVLALVRERGLRCWSHVDERCAGFFALGVAKATGTPSVVCCTSGTAAANLAPAVHEAHQARVPLLVLTADRPPELREVGAGQVIDQVKLFGTAAKWSFEVGTHDATPDRLRWMRALACRAHATALEGRPGVVHLNFALREPLVPPDPLPGDDTGPRGWRPLRAPRGRPPRSPTRRDRAPVCTGGRSPPRRAGVRSGRGVPRPGRRGGRPGRDHRVPGAGRPAVRRTARPGGRRPLRRAAARRSIRGHAPPRPNPARGRPAHLQAAARLAGPRSRRGAGGARPAGRLAGPRRGGGPVPGR